MYGSGPPSDGRYMCAWTPKRRMRRGSGFPTSGLTSCSPASRSRSAADGGVTSRIPHSPMISSGRRPFMPPWCPNGRGRRALKLGSKPRRARASSEALRIDVDDRGELGPPHRRGGGGEQPGGLRRDPPRLVRLRDQLRAVLAAQTKKCRRAEQLGIRDPRLQLVERADDRLDRRSAHEDPHEVGEGRVAECATPFELLG